MFSIGFRVVSAPFEPRRLIDWPRAFDAYCAAAPVAEPHRPAWLSAFCFGDDFADYLRVRGSPRGFAGPTWSRWLWFDLDSPDDPQHAAADAGGLVDAVATCYGISPEAVPVWFSGRKGFHVGLPLSLCGAPGPSERFHRVCRKLAEHLAEVASVSIDTGIYDAVRLFRCPNSKHEKSGLYKVPVSFDELQGPVDAILSKATSPVPFSMAAEPPACAAAIEDWRQAEAAVAADAEAKRVRQADPDRRLNRWTVELVRGNLPARGDRHRALFSAAADLAEHGTPGEVIAELLTEPGLDSGLPPGEVRRQIACGIEHGRGAPGDVSGAEATPTHPKRPTADDLRKLWRAQQ